MSFTAALILGLLSSGHCLAMCGSLVASLNLTNVSKRSVSWPMYKHNLLLNLGRTTTYTILGVTAAAIVGIVGYATAFPQWGIILRYMTGIAMVIAGIQIGFIADIYKAIGRKPSCCEMTKLHRPMEAFSLIATRKSSYLTGLIWGMIPCGMIYNILLIAGSSGNIPKAAIIMTGFGLGTLPTMMLSGISAHKFRQLIAAKYFRRLAGLLLIVLGISFLSAESFAPGVMANPFELVVQQDNFPLMCH